MSRTELTIEIQKIIESMPDAVLSEVLAYLKMHQEKSENEIKLSQNLGQILSEDRDLLKRLAQ